MVKFSKELEAQLIPEWRAAFVDYWQLKKHIKKIKLTRKAHHHDSSSAAAAPTSSFSVSVISSFLGICRSQTPPVTVDVKSVRDDGGEGAENEAYEEELRGLFSEEEEVKVFFERLDDELRKVEEFYVEKECEFVERDEILKNQLRILVEVKRRFLSHSSCSGKGEENEKVKSSKAISSGKTGMLWEELVINQKKERYEISRRGIQQAEKMIRGAFVELYRALRLLKTYSYLNMVAFSKILKKFDKVSCKQTSTTYMKCVKGSLFISSDKVWRLMEGLESSFTKNFADSDRKKAMKFLSPRKKKSSHMITFFVGLLTGCFLSLFGVYGILAHVSGMFSSHAEKNDTTYVDAIYPVFSMFALFSLHVFVYGCNLFAWKTTRINYNFIFDFSPSTSLKHRDAFLISSSFMTLVVASLLLHLIFRHNPFYPPALDSLPALLLLFFLALLICPFNAFYRQTRYCFLRVLRNILFSPFYKVVMVDFFMADQLTSQIPLLRHMESTTCYLLACFFNTHGYQSCQNNRMYRELSFIISFLPYYWRAMQCGRRWFEDNDMAHLANMGKYMSAMVAAGTRLTYSRQPSQSWMAMVIITSLFSTLYQLYWDFVKDWGFFDFHSHNLWLRDDLVLRHKGVYYTSIVVNLVLRVAWVETVTRINVGLLETRMLDFLLASLEVIRRGHWNFYRLENEHLNNVGKFRAVKVVPLPFQHTLDFST